MRFRILAGPDYMEMVAGMEELKEGKNKPSLTFKIRPLGAHLTIPDIVIATKTILPEQGDHQLGFRFTGRSVEGDKCEAIYRPFKKKKKGIMRLSD